MHADLVLFKTFGEALAIGLLVGIERYKSRAEAETDSAGVRTFAVIALLGAVAAIVDHTAMLTIFGGLLLFLALGYWRDSKRSLGTTTEFAAVLTFWLGYLTATHEALAISAAIVLTILLAHKQALHGFVKGRISDVEFYDTLKFLLVVFVVYPLLPDTYLTRYEFIRPTQLWLLVILISTISYSGYVLIRWLGGTRGLQLNALVGGLVSTTAITVSLAERARAAPQMVRMLGVTAVMANAVQGPRLLVLVWVVDDEIGRLMALPLIGASVITVVIALVLGRVRNVWTEEPEMEVLLTNPYSFRPALKFACLIAGVLVISKVGEAWLGEEAVYGIAAVAGLADVSAISISVAQLAADGALDAWPAAVAIVLAMATNALVKIGLAWVSGTRSLAFWLGGGLVTLVGAAGLLTWVAFEYQHVILAIGR